MRMFTCPDCGKWLVPLCSDGKRVAFWCDDCNIDIELWPDEETPVSIIGEGHIRVDWYNAGEGLCGDYDPENPDDVNLLRFDVYKGIPEGDDMICWEAVEDASYCTRVPADTDMEVLAKLLYRIYEKYYDAIVVSEADSVKKLGEALSWIEP